MAFTLLTYAQFEAMIGTLYQADQSAQAGALRGRLKHLARLGFSFGSYSEGERRKSYWDDDVLMTAICLDLEEAGLDPAVIVNFITRQRQDILVHMRLTGAVRTLLDALSSDHVSSGPKSKRSARPRSTRYLCLQMDMMSSRWTMENDGSEVQRRYPGVRHMEVVSAEGLPEICINRGASATWIVIDIGRRRDQIAELMKPYLETELKRGHDKETTAPER